MTNTTKSLAGVFRRLVVSFATLSFGFACAFGADLCRSDEKVVLDTHQVLQVVSLHPLSTKNLRPGDRVEFLLAEPVWLAPGIELEPGTRVSAEVERSRRAGRLFRKARLRLGFRWIEVCRERIPLDAEPLKFKGRSTALKTAGGFVTGGGLGYAAHPAAGVVLGALAAGRRGPNVTINPGSPLAIRIKSPVVLRAAPPPRQDGLVVPPAPGRPNRPR